MKEIKVTCDNILRAGNLRRAYVKCRKGGRPVFLLVVTRAAKGEKEIKKMVGEVAGLADRGEIIVL